MNLKEESYERSRAVRIMSDDEASLKLAVCSNG